MGFNPFNLFKKNFIGVDIGTSLIKVVELSSLAGRGKLENYGFLAANVLHKEKFRDSGKDVLNLSSKDVSRAITAIREEAGIKSNKAVFSIPDFSTFFTNFTLPPMKKGEIASAVEFEAKKHIPISVNDVVLDWQVLDPPKNKAETKILLVAVPKDIISQYQEIAKMAKINLVFLEAEVFGLVRSLVPADEKDPVALVDIGAQTTSCSIISEGTLSASHSFNVSGKELTEAVAKSSGISYNEAEEIKKKNGLNSEKFGNVFRPVAEEIVSELKQVLAGASKNQGVSIKKIILTGGAAYMPGLTEYLNSQLNADVAVGNPFSKVVYPPILGDTLKKIGPSFSVAVGMALRGLES